MEEKREKGTFLGRSIDQLLEVAFERNLRVLLGKTSSGLFSCRLDDQPLWIHTDLRQAFRLALEADDELREEALRENAKELLLAADAYLCHGGESNRSHLQRAIEKARGKTPSKPHDLSF